MGGVLRTRDHDDRAIGQPVVERGRGHAELAPTLADPDLQTGLADAAKMLETRRVARRRASSRAIVAAAATPRPDRVGAVPRELVGGHAHDAGHERLEERLVPARVGEGGELRGERERRPAAGGAPS